MSLFSYHRRAPGVPWLQVFIAWGIMQYTVRLVVTLLYRLRLEGRENLRETGPMIYVCNHQAYLDPPVVGTLLCRRPCVILGRASLFRYRISAAFFRFIFTIPLNQKRGGEALRAAVQELEAGRCVLLFPEGARTRDGRMNRFRNGFLHLVKKTRAPVIPIALEGAWDVQPPGRIFPRPWGRITLRAGTPIPADELLQRETNEAAEYVRQSVDRMRLEIRHQMRQRTRGRYPRESVGDDPAPDLSPR